MPKNALRVQRLADNTFSVNVWGPGGAKHDLTSKFKEITAIKAPSPFETQIVFEYDGSRSTLEFGSAEKDLQFALPEVIAKQLIDIADVP